MVPQKLTESMSTRVEFDPPSLRLPGRRKPVLRLQQRGSNSTLLHCGYWPKRGSVPGLNNEGRIRPSFIAAGACWWGWRARTVTTRVEFDPPSLRQINLTNNSSSTPFQRGSNSTLLHCGPLVHTTPHPGGVQRGSNSTLLHCGLSK